MLLFECWFKYGIPYLFPALIISLTASAGIFLASKLIKIHLVVWILPTGLLLYRCSLPFPETLVHHTFQRWVVIENNFFQSFNWSSNLIFGGVLIALLSSFILRILLGGWHRNFNLQPTSRAHHLPVICVGLLPMTMIGAGISIHPGFESPSKQWFERFDDTILSETEIHLAFEFLDRELNSLEHKYNQEELHQQKRYSDLQLHLQNFEDLLGISYDSLLLKKEHNQEILLLVEQMAEIHNQINHHSKQQYLLSKISQIKHAKTPPQAQTSTATTPCHPMHATHPQLALPSCPQSWPHPSCRPQCPFYWHHSVEGQIQGDFKN